MLAENPRAANGHILKGKLLVLKAKASRTESEKRTIARSAEESFQEALRLNPGLSRRYAADLRELKSL